ncbi:hypothetical protein MMC16_000745 [Acarospora aff. strigata]|nr:hypothetical protein [Acarospora aff. strigata]
MSSPTSNVEIAVIGGGLIGPRQAACVLKSPETILIALVDPAPHSERLAAELGTNHYPSVTDLLRSPHKPHAAIVCTPNHTHVPIAKELASSGVHVLVEKPISTDIESGSELIRIAEEAGIRLLVGHHRRFNPYLVATKQAVASGALGDIVAVNGLWTAIKPANYFNAPTEWRRGETGGVILINLIHEVDLMHYLFGPIVRIHAEKTCSRRGHKAEEGAALTFRFKSGVVGTFLISDNVPSPYNFEAGTGENPIIPHVGADFYRIFGTEASLSVPDMTVWSYGDDMSGKSWLNPLPQKKLSVTHAVPFDLQLAHFVRVIRGEEEPSCSGQAGLQALIVCDAVKRALGTGGTVELNMSKL